jgi:signal transduction histidine kinase
MNLTNLFILILYAAGIWKGIPLNDISYEILFLFIGSAAYMFSRTPHYQLAALFTIVASNFFIYLIAMPNGDTESAYLFVYLAIPMLLSSLFLRFRAMILIFLINMFGMVAFAATFGVPISEMPLTFYIIVSLFIFISSHYRNYLEDQRQADLKERNAELDAFAHTLAHDLKNELSKIVGHSEVLADDLDKLSREEIIYGVRVISSSSQKLSSVIDSLLLFSSVRGLEQVELCLLNMEDVVLEVMSRLLHMIEEYDAEFSIQDEWPSAWGYAPWVEEVWINYITNALKYGGTPPRISLGADDADQGMVKYWVRDNGAGLTLEEQRQLFVPFERLRKRGKGHGLGLSIVRRIVNRLGGEVGVESEIGKGSTFYFTLPAP